jgi:hypothetical protein
MKVTHARHPHCDIRALPSAAATLQKGQTRVAAQLPQFTKLFVSFSVRHTAAV